MQPIFAVHCTRKSNVSGILRDGLLPRHPNGEYGNYKSCGLSDQPTGIYFGGFDCTWGGEVAMVVDVRGYKYVRDNCVADAFVVTERIPHERIITLFISVPYYDLDDVAPRYPRPADQARTWAELNRDRGTMVNAAMIYEGLLPPKDSYRLPGALGEFVPKFYDPIEAFR